MKQYEAEIQIMLFQWAQLSAGKYPELKLLYHCPNGGSRNKIEAARLKAQGVRAGIPDLFLPVARSGYYGLYLELKSAKGRLQDTQKAWLNELSQQGYKTAVCFSFDAARDTIINYLKGESV